MSHIDYSSVNSSQDPPHDPSSSKSPATPGEEANPLTKFEHHSNGHRLDKISVPQLICYTLHIIFILLHITLLLLWHFQVEHRIMFPIGQISNRVSVVLVQLLQVFGTLYTAALLISTQQLALHRDLVKRQTLTAINDKSTAWSGLGAALMTLWRQNDVPAAVYGTIAVTAYLACLSVLHITTPALVSVEVFNLTRELAVRTTDGLPNITYNNYTFNLFAQAGALLPYTSMLDETQQLGLQNATVYDVLQSPGVGNATVNATTFDVSCGFLSNATISPLKPQDNITSQWILSLPYGHFTLRSVVHIMGEDMVRWSGWNNSDSLHIPDLRENAIFYASTNFTDSNGNVGSILSLNPPMALNDTTSGDSGSIPALQFMGCTLSLTNQTAIIDAETNLLLSLDSSDEKTESEWKPWNYSITSQVPNPVAGYLIDGWDAMFGWVPPTDTFFSDICDQTLLGGCDLISMAEQYIMGSSGIANFRTLHELENALARVTALIYWTGGHYVNPHSVSNVNANSTDPGLSMDSFLLEGQTNALQVLLTSRLQINISQVAIGLIVSVILLLLAIALAWHSEIDDSTLDSSGILHVIWLLRGRPALSQRIGEVDDPEINNLRRAGMFEVRIADHDDM